MTSFTACKTQSKIYWTIFSMLNSRTILPEWFLWKTVLSREASKRDGCISFSLLLFRCFGGGTFSERWKEGESSMLWKSTLKIFQWALSNEIHVIRSLATPRNCVRIRRDKCRNQGPQMLPKGILHFTSPALVVVPKDIKKLPWEPTLLGSLNLLQKTQTLMSSG